MSAALHILLTPLMRNPYLFTGRKEGRKYMSASCTPHTANPTHVKFLFIYRKEGRKHLSANCTSHTADISNV